MEKQKIQIGERDLEFVVNRRRGLKSIRLSVKAGPVLVVSAPKLITVSYLKELVSSKIDWVISAMEKIGNKPNNLPGYSPLIGYRGYRARAKKHIKERLEYYNQYYGFKYERISIKNHSSLWGSCSSKGNLNFNYRLIFLEPEISDLVIVHELCHLKEMNHSLRFWSLVAKTIPNYRVLNRRLKAIKF